MYEAWLQTTKDAKNFFVAERLKTTTLGILTDKKDPNRAEDFVSEFVQLRNMLDTKESKFIFR